MPTSRLQLAVLLWFAAMLAAGCVQLGPIAPMAPPFDAVLLAEADTAVQSFIDKKQLPGAVYYLEHQRRIYEKAYGHLTYENDAAPVHVDTIFDAASLTKIIATTPSVMMLVEEGKLKLDAHLTDYFPECANGGKEAITLRQLLTHTSGLSASLAPKPPWSGAAAALALACKQKVTHPPGTFFRYSDINFVLLGELVKKASGLPLDQFAARRIYGPLGMRDSGFLPLQRFAAERIAPTQLITEASLVESLHGDLAAGSVLRGVVHDPTARFMGGVAGSAGLFTTAADLARYARMILNGGELDGVRILSRESVRLMTTVQTPEAVASRRAIGFDIDSAYSRPRGTVFPIGSYGHTGFTGCILWIDPFSKTFYIFLSNRVYPKDGTNIVPLYNILGTLSAQALTDFDFSNVQGALARSAATPASLLPPPTP